MPPVKCAARRGLTPCNHSHDTRKEALHYACDEAKKPPAYLREARSRAGYANRVAASMAVPFSPETIGRHERGDVEMEPEDVILYSEKYRDPSILVHYCADCPIGKRTGKAVTDRPLPFATLRVSRMLDGGPAIATGWRTLPLMGKLTPGRRRTSRMPWPSSGSWTRPSTICCCSVCGRE